MIWLEMKKIIIRFVALVLGIEPRLSVRVLFGDIWRLREYVQSASRDDGFVKRGFASVAYLLAERYWETYGSWVAGRAVFEEPPIFPHGPVGLFVSSEAHIGKKCVIFQQVTIGSNTLKDGKNIGAPWLEDNVYIGCGAKIIGNVHVGKNARIGANCVVVKDVPANSVTVIRGVESIVKDTELDNEYVPIDMFITED